MFRRGMSHCSAATVGESRGVGRLDISVEKKNTRVRTEDMVNRIAAGWLSQAEDLVSVRIARTVYSAPGCGEVGVRRAVAIYNNSLQKCYK